MKTTLALALCATLASCSKAPVPVAVAAAPTAEQICRRDVAAQGNFRDPESVRIRSVKPNGGNHFNIIVSAKNAYGGYGDPMRCQCKGDPEVGKITYLFCGPNT